MICSLRDHHALNFQSELQHLTTTHPQIKVIYHFTKKEGHLNQRQLENYIPELKTHQDANYFLCGTKMMTKNIIINLEDAKVASQMITSEGFIF